MVVVEYSVESMASLQEYLHRRQELQFVHSQCPMQPAQQVAIYHRHFDKLMGSHHHPEKEE